MKEQIENALLWPPFRQPLFFKRSFYIYRSGAPYGGQRGAAMVTPKPRFKIGASCQYFSVEDLASAIGTTEKHVRGLCAALEIPVLHFPGHPSDKGYVLLYALESALFGLGMPKKIRMDEGLRRVHQELAGVLYGTLTKEALVKRVKMLAKELTQAGSSAKIPQKKVRKKHWNRNDYKKFGGVDPRG